MLVEDMLGVGKMIFVYVLVCLMDLLFLCI